MYATKTYQTRSSTVVGQFFFEILFFMTYTPRRLLLTSGKYFNSLVFKSKIYDQTHFDKVTLTTVHRCVFSRFDLHFDVLSKFIFL